MSGRINLFSPKGQKELGISACEESATGTLTPPPFKSEYVSEKTVTGVHAALVSGEPELPEPEIYYPATDSVRKGSGLVPSVTQTAAQARERSQAVAAARLGQGRWKRPELSDALVANPPARQAAPAAAQPSAAAPSPDARSTQSFKAVQAAARATGAFVVVPAAARQTGSFVAQPAVAPSDDARATQSFKAVPPEASPSTSALRRAVGSAVSERLPSATKPSPDHVEMVDDGLDSDVFRLEGEARTRPTSELNFITPADAEEYVRKYLPEIRQKVHGDPFKPLAWADLPKIRQIVGYGEFPGLSAWYVRVGDQAYSGAEYLLGLHKPVGKGRAFTVLRAGPQMYYVDPETGLLYTEAQRQAAQQPAKTGLFGMTTRLFNRR